MQALTSKYKFDRADLADWISFRSSNLMEEISPSPEVPCANTYSLHCTENEVFH